MGTRMRPSPAMVVAMLALFVSIGGVGFAAGVIDTDDIRNGAVTAKKLHRKAVSSEKLKRRAVKAEKISPDAVDSSKILDGTIQTGDLGDAQVTSDKLADEAVTSLKLGFGAVATGKLEDAAVTTEKLGNDAVTNAKLGDSAVTSRVLADESVSANKLAGLQRHINIVSVADNSEQLVFADCQPQERVLTGGGAFTVELPTAQAAKVHIMASLPTAGLDSWAVQVYNGSGAAREFAAVAYCLPN